MTPLPTIVANFKMNGTRAFFSDWMWTFLGELTAGLETKTLERKILLAPPATYLGLFGDVSLGILENALDGMLAISGQDCGAEREGAFTGTISARMLADVGAQAVILGHSECRQAGDTNGSVSQKIRCALEANLTPILCVGESAPVRDAGETNAFVCDQLLDCLPEDLRKTPGSLDKLMIAYEPLWAIGTGHTPSLDNIAQVHEALADTLQKACGIAPSILYGGSVTLNNGDSILSLPHVGGVLVGKACFDPKIFSALCLGDGLCTP